MELTSEQKEKLREECGLSDIHAMRRRLLTYQIKYIEIWLEPFRKANYIDSEIAMLEDIVRRMKPVEV